MRICERFLNALFILVLCGVLLGALFVQYFDKEVPCPLCFLQRLAMISVACGPLMNLRFGIKGAHYGFSLFSCLFGASVSLRQISLHVCPQFPTFGEPVFDLSLYTWAFIVFCSSLFAIGLLLFIHDCAKNPEVPDEFNLLDKVAFASLLFVAAANIGSSLEVCGLGPCEG